MPRKKSTEADWRELGFLVRLAHRITQKAVVKAGPMLRKSDRGFQALNASRKKFLTAKDHLERAMYHAGGPDDLGVFYGRMETSIPEILDALNLQDGEEVRGGPDGC